MYSESVADDKVNCDRFASNTIVQFLNLFILMRVQCMMYDVCVGVGTSKKTNLYATRNLCLIFFCDSQRFI